MASLPVRRRVNAGPPTGAPPRTNEHEISRRQHPSDTAVASSSPQNPHERNGSSRVPATTSATPRGVPAPGGGAPPPAIGDGSSSPKFLHNLRVWALGGPCVGVLLLLGGRPTSLGVAFGVMACYCFDLADNAEGALVSVWGAVLWSAGTLLWAGSTLGLVHKANVLACTLLVGVWATLQFGTIYRDGPDAARLLERLLFACFPLPAAAILTWAGVAFGGATYAAPCVALFMYAAVGLYAVPLRSGLGGGGAGGVHGDSRAPCLLCACMLLLPALVQISVDYRLLVWAGGAVRWKSLQKVALAASLPWPMLLSLRSKGVLWWATPGLGRRLDKILSVGGAVSLLVLCETSKSLVLLPVFRPFLFSAPRPPLDSLLASAVLACLAAAWFAQGRAGQRGVYAARALTVASVRCLGLLLGVEQAVMPLFDLSAFALSMLVFSGRRDLKAYVVGVAGVSSFILWFSWQTVWHLSFSFALPLGPRHWEGGATSSSPPLSSSLSLQQVSACCAALSFGVLLVPGMVAFGVRQVAIGVVFGLHAVVLMLLEIVLVGAEARDPWQLDGLYPLPLVALTGVLGIWMAFRLVRDHGVDPLFLWVPGSIGAAKMLAYFLAVLVPTDGESPEMSYLFTVVPIVSLAMAAAAPFALFRRTPPTQAAVGTRLGSGEPVGSGIAEDWSGPMVPLEGGLCVFFMASALYICSRPVISPLLRELLSGGRHVASASASLVDSPAHSLAFCGVVLALYALAVVSRHFPDSRVARRSGAALLVTSMALLVLQPSALSGVVEGEHGGVGRSWKSRREYVEQACGVAVAGVGVLTLTGLTSPTKTLARRAAFAVAVGVPVGIWSALASMPGAAAAIVSWSALGAAGTYSCALMVLLEAALPRPAAVLSRRGSGSRAGGGGPAVGRARRVGSVVVELYVAVVAFMPAAGIAQGLQLLILGPVGRNLMGLAPPTGHNDGGGGGGGEGTNAQGAASFALATAATGHAVITVALKLLEERTGGAGGSGGGGGGDGRGAGAGFGRRRGVQGPASVSRAFGEARWIPSMGNASAIFSAVGAFFCCWRHLPGESARALAAIPCCALLLLLQEDGRILRGDTGFGAAVPAGALSATWAGSAAFYILLKGSSLAGAPRSSFSLMSLLGGGLLRPALGVYRGVLHHFHGAYGAADSRRHGEAAVALRAVSFWTADSPWQPLWNLALLAVSVPSHAFLARFLWGGRGSTPQRASEVLAALAINALPLIAADLTSINLMGLTGLAGGLVQLWLLRERQATGRRII